VTPAESRRLASLFNTAAFAGIDLDTRLAFAVRFKADKLTAVDRSRIAAADAQLDVLRNHK